MDELNGTIRSNHIDRLQNGECTIEQGFVLTDILTDLERISDHCSNIAACISQVRDGELDTHRYLEHVRNENDGTFAKEYRRLREIYRIPSKKEESSDGRNKRN